MNNEHEKRWEAAIDRELKQLPDISAPNTLIARVRAKIEAREERTERVLSAGSSLRHGLGFAMLALFFGGLCFAVWHLQQTPLATLAGGRLEQSLAGFALVWNTLAVLAGAVGAAVRHVGVGFLFVGGLLISLIYCAFMGLGTVMFRIATVRR